MEETEREPEHLKILAFDNGTASRVWRFDGFASRINKYSPHEMLVASTNQWKGDALGANLVIFEMATGKGPIIEAKKQGAKVVYEVDDASVDTYGRERKNLTHLPENRRQGTIECVNECDAVFVTNIYLADNFRKFTKPEIPIYVIPNYMDFEWYGKHEWNIERNSDEIRIGWFGSRSHYEDLRMMLPALQEVLEKYPNVKFVYCGYGGMSSDKKVTEIGWGEDVFREIPRHRREFYIAVKPELWAEKHRSLDLDIGICPLVDDYFNHCKTNIKWQEYAALGTPTVCSPAVYAEHPLDKNKSTISHGKTGFIAKGKDEWVKYLSTLIEGKQLRKKMGKAAKLELNKKWDLDLHWKKWVEICETIVFEK